MLLLTICSIHRNRFILQEHYITKEKDMVKCHFICDYNTPNFDPVYIGINWLLGKRGYKTGYIAIHGLRDLNAYSSRNGLENLDRLRKSPHLQIWNGMRCGLILQSKIPCVNASPVLVLHPNKKYLDKIYSIKNISEMFVVGYPEDIESWIRYSDAIEHGETKPKYRSLSLNKVVENALVSATNVINIANGMNHPRNKDIITNTFQVLIENKERLNSEDVKTWLIQKRKWDPEDAQMVLEIIEGLKAGKKYKLWMPDHFWIDGIIDYWRNNHALEQTT